MKKIQVRVNGIVSGFTQEGETDDEAAARLVLEAERFGNDGKARIHLTLNDKPAPTVGQNSKT